METMENKSANHIRKGKQHVSRSGSCQGHCSSASQARRLMGCQQIQITAPVPLPCFGTSWKGRSCDSQ